MSLFGPKYQRKNSALASKKRLNQNKMTALYFLIIQKLFDERFFLFGLFLETKLEIFKRFRWYFGQNDDTKRTF